MVRKAAEHCGDLNSDSGDCVALKVFVLGGVSAALICQETQSCQVGGRFIPDIWRLCHANNLACRTLKIRQNEFSDSLPQYSGSAPPFVHTF